MAFLSEQDNTSIADSPLIELKQNRSKAEIELGTATKNLEKFYLSGVRETQKLQALKDLETKASYRWQTSFYNILNYEPHSLREIGLKISIVLQAIEEGYDDPKLMATLYDIAEDLVDGAV